MIPAIKIDTSISIRVKPEAEAGRTLVEAPKLKADLRPELGDRLLRIFILTFFVRCSQGSSKAIAGVCQLTLCIDGRGRSLHQFEGRQFALDVSF